jgi:hypothetical protein
MSSVACTSLHIGLKKKSAGERAVLQRAFEVEVYALTA